VGEGALFLRKDIKYWRPIMVTLLHLNILLYSCCFGLVVPVLPYMVEAMGVDGTIVYGYLQTTYSVLQLIGAPMVGVIGDRYGTKYALVVSFIASALNYFMLGSAKTVEMLFLSRIPALLQHALLASQSYISDITPENERSARMGRISLSFGVGVVIGPAIGGVISKNFSYAAMAYFAGFISTVNTALLLLFMEEPPPRLVRKSSSASKYNFSIAIVKTIFQNKTVLTLFVLRVAASLPSAIFHSISPIITKTQFGLDAQKNGFVMSYVGVMMAIAQGVIVGYVSSRFKDHKIMLYATISLTCFSLALLLFVTSIWEFMVFLGPLICSGAVLNTVITSALSKAVDKSEIGRILGVDMSLASASRVIAPTIGSFLYSEFGGYSTILMVNVGMFSLASIWTKYQVVSY